MKIKTLLSIALLGAMFVSFPAQAQKKKTSSARKTTTAKVLKAEDVEDCSYLGFVTYQPDGSALLVTFSLPSDDSQTTLNLAGTDMSMNWKIANGKIALSNSGSELSLTSSNEGYTLTGNYFMKRNNSNSKSVFGAYDVEGNFDAKTFTSGANSDKYYTYLGFQSDGMKVAIPVTVNFTNSDSNSYTFKVTSNHRAMSELGVVKGEVTFNKDGMEVEAFKTTTVPNDEMTNYFVAIPLGTKRISGGNSPLVLYFIKK